MQIAGRRRRTRGCGNVRRKQGKVFWKTEILARASERKTRGRFGVYPGWLNDYLRLISMTVLDVSPLVMASTLSFTKITAVVSSSVQNPSAFLCDDL